MSITAIRSPYGKKLYVDIFTHQLDGSKLKALCKRLGADADRSTQNNPYTPAEAKVSKDLALLGEAIKTIRPAVAKDYFDSGMKYLMGKAYTPTGRRRLTADAMKFSERDLVVLSRATEIAVVDIHYEFTSHRTYSLPVYEVRSPDGEFRYYSSAWQSGGVFQIIKHAG